LALVSLDNLNFDYGREKILRGVNLALQPQVRCGLVGANGAGKTTLMAALAGRLDVPAGTRQVQGSVSIATLRQESTLDVDEDPQALLLHRVGELAFARERALERELAEITGQLSGEAQAPAATERLIQRQGHLQAEFERLGGYAMRSRLEAALLGVGLPTETWRRPLSALSGGERRRAALTVVLLGGADLLLLDEPTNHLDLASCEWLEGFLATCGSAAVIVSHDRYFLDRVTTRTLHLDRGRLVNYSGNYSFFAEQSRMRYEQDLNAWERQQARIKQTEEYIRRNIEGQNTKQAQARRKQLAKEERLEKPTPPAGLYSFSLTPARRSGATVLQTEDLGATVDGRTLIENLNLHISRDEKVGILGPNGCGKSTLLRIFVGQRIPDSGRVVVGHGVDIGYYDQDLSLVADHNTVLAEMAAVDPRATPGELRSFLGAFGFGEEIYDRQVGRLSGGERGRLSLLRLVKEGHNSLLLDEPTNHLDVRSRESLEAALRESPGTVVVVSHDRRFLDKIVHRLLVFPARDADARDAGSIEDFPGNYSQWVVAKGEADREQRKFDAPSPSGPASPRGAGEETAAPKPTLSKNEIHRRQQWIAEVEGRIKKLEAEQTTAVEAIGRPETDNEDRLELSRRCREIETALTTCLEQWEAWHLEIEEGADPQS